MKVCITGGAGFVGSNLATHLLESGVASSVSVIDDLSYGNKANLAGLDVELVEASILDRESLDEAVAGSDAIVHLAAIGSVPRSVDDPVRSHDANVNGTLAVLEAARRHGNLHTIFSSSSSVYGRNPTLPKSEDMRPIPVSPYAVSKLAGESYMIAYGACYDLPVLPFRFFNVFGPGQAAGHAYAAVIPAFLDRAMRGEPLVVHGDGMQSRDFTYVGTVCRTITEALQRRVTSPDPVNLAFGSRHTLVDVIAEMEQQLGTQLTREHTEPRAGDVRHSQADSSRLMALFPELEPVAFAEGLGHTIDWFRSL